MAIAAPTLSSSKQIFKEYNSLFTQGRLTNLSATRPFTEYLYQLPGVGYPWFLLDPTIDGFNTSKNYYLSSANRQVSGYPQTVTPNNIQEAYGKCIPWSNLTLGPSAQYISQAFIDNTKNQPFWFYVVPPSGNPIPVVIHYPKYSNENPQPLTPINEWYVSPVGIELGKPALTFWSTTTGAAIELTVPGNKVIRHDTTNPLVTSFVWIESFLAYISMMNMPSAQRSNGTKLKTGVFANTLPTLSSNVVGYSPTDVLVPSDIYDTDALYQAKSHKNAYSTTNYLTQLHKVLSSSGIFNKSFSTGETAQQFLSAFYTHKPYDKTADIRTMFNLLTGKTPQWHMPISYAGIFRGPANVIIGANNRQQLLTLPNPARSSLTYGVPTQTFAGKISGWSATDVSYANSRGARFAYSTVVKKYLAHWRTLSSLPLTALEMFNFNPVVNTVVVTKQPVFIDFKRVASWTMYHPELSTWVHYASAPGLEFFTKTGLITSTNFVTPSSYKNVILSAISLEINTPNNYKVTNTGTKFGKYEVYVDKAPLTTTTVVDVTARGSIPLTALNIQNVTYVTDYTPQTIHNDRVLSGTLFIVASGLIAPNQVRNFVSQYKTKPNARIVIPPTRFAVRTAVTILSGATIQTSPRYLPTLSIYTLGVLPATGTYVRTATISGTVVPYIAYATGSIPANVLLASKSYRALELEFSGPTNNNRIREILSDKTTYPVWSNIASVRVNNEWVPVLDMRRGLGNYEVISINQPTKVGIAPFNNFGQTYGTTQMFIGGGSTVRSPYNYQPTLTFNVPVTTASDIGKLNWPTTVYRRRPRPTRAQYSVRRRKTVLGY